MPPRSNEPPRRSEEQLGPIDVWVNDAMVSVFSPFKEMTAEEFRRVTEVTYLGFVYGTMAALKRMLPRNRGTIVQVGSALAYRGIPLQSAYCGAKHAILGFTEAVRCELMHDKSNVWLTMVQMPALNTPQFGWVKSRLPRKPQPVPPIYEPEVAAEAIYFAAHARRREVYVGLSTVVAIEGNKVLAGVGDKYLARNRLRQPDDEPARRSRIGPTIFGNRCQAIAEHTAPSASGLTNTACSFGPRCIDRGWCWPGWVWRCARSPDWRTEAASIRRAVR